jgi:hypothetical protein
MAGISRDTTLVSASDNWDLVDAMGWGGVPWTDVFSARPTSEAPDLTEFLTKSPSVAFTRNGGITAPFTYGGRQMAKNQALDDAIKLIALGS